MSIDTIGDFLTIIRNGIMASKPWIQAPYSNMRNAIALILKEEGFIHDFEKIEEQGKTYIRVLLKYVDGESAIHEIKRASKPGRRYYAGVKEVRPVIGGLGISILSTNRGVLSHKQAKQLGIGGEVICTIW